MSMSTRSVENFTCEPSIKEMSIEEYDAVFALLVPAVVAAKECPSR